MTTITRNRKGVECAPIESADALAEFVGLRYTDLEIKGRRKLRDAEITGREITGRGNYGTFSIFKFN